MTTPKGLFPPSDFNDWAESYDRTVPTSQDFPFTGYTNALDLVVTQSNATPGMRVLDLGTGTGNLALRFAALGCDLWCTDFSEPMLNKARAKIPSAYFFLHDLRTPLPVEIKGPFDRIVSGYVFHHFPLEEKARILMGFLPRLSSEGRIIIADIAFPDKAAQIRVREEVGADWDDEYYWVVDETMPALRHFGLEVEYIPVSKCAGVFMLQVGIGSS